jgi:hypothetical protein
MSQSSSAGNLIAHRVVELDAPFLPALELLPALSPGLLAENRSWHLG